jgi:hypothetical protein
LATCLCSLTPVAHEGTLGLVTSATSDLHEQSAQDTAPARGFDAFLSYSHAADWRLAPALQTALQSIGKPWYRRRALRVFRDTTSLSASPELWPAIERALERSRHFILLVSPDSAPSPWVDKEVGWWRDHRESATCLIALTAGELGWDERRADFTAESSVPPSLRAWFPSEPLWIDLRWAHDDDHLSTRNPTFRDAAATLAVPLRGIDPEAHGVVEHAARGDQRAPVTAERELVDVARTNSSERTSASIGVRSVTTSFAPESERRRRIELSP